MPDNNFGIFPARNTQDWLTRIKTIAVESERVKLTHHAQVRLVERDITLSQVLKVLRHGVFSQEAHKTPKGDWKFTMRHHIAGMFIHVAGAVSINAKGENVIVITVFEES